MRITATEYKVLDRFYKKYFKTKFYIAKVKPEIDRFIIDEKLDYNKTKWREILSLYTFNFWSFSYTLEQPSLEFVLNTFKQYK